VHSHSHFSIFDCLRCKWHLLQGIKNVSVLAFILFDSITNIDNMPPKSMSDLDWIYTQALVGMHAGLTMLASLDVP
jgi:hypothetical protein